MNYEKGMILKKVKAGNDRTNIGMEITLVKKLSNVAWSTTGIGTYTENYLNENFELVTKRKVEDGKMREFKVGDIVCGNSSTRYEITNTDMTKGKVIRFYDDGSFEVKILEHKCKSEIGENFSFLDPKYFDLVSRAKDTKLPNKKFGFKIGEKVMCMGNVETVIAFTKDKKSNYIYITGHCDCSTSLADRPINNWAIVNKDRLQHIPETPVAKVGMYVKVINELGGAPAGSICKIITTEASGYTCYYYKKPDTERTNWYGTIGFSLELMPEGYKPMRVFTDDQIAEAEQIIGRLSVYLGNLRASYKLIRDGAETKINIYSESGFCVLTSGSTKRSPYDTDNSTIGLMIALCRATGKRHMIPKWVFNG